MSISAVFGKSSIPLITCTKLIAHSSIQPEAPVLDTFEAVIMEKTCTYTVAAQVNADADIQQVVVTDFTGGVGKVNTVAMVKPSVFAGSCR